MGQSSMRDDCGAIFRSIAEKERKRKREEEQADRSGLQPPLEAAARGAFHRDDKFWNLQARDTDMRGRRHYCCRCRCRRAKAFVQNISAPSVVQFA